MNGWINNLGAGDLRRHYTNYDFIVMIHAFQNLNNDYADEDGYG